MIVIRQYIMRLNESSINSRLKILLIHERKCNSLIILLLNQKEFFSIITLSVEDIFFFCASNIVYVVLNVFRKEEN